MQVAKYWRNKKLRYRLEGLARQEARVIAGAQSTNKDADRKGRNTLKHEAMRLVQ